MRTPVLIFDFGNVVAHFDYARACEPLAAPLGLTGSQLLERCRERGFTPGDDRWRLEVVTNSLHRVRVSNSSTWAIVCILKKVAPFEDQHP